VQYEGGRTTSHRRQEAGTSGTTTNSQVSQQAWCPFNVVSSSYHDGWLWWPLAEDKILNRWLLSCPCSMAPPRLAAGEFKPKQSLGQNFLTDPNYILKIVRSLNDDSPGTTPPNHCTTRFFTDLLPSVRPCFLPSSPNSPPPSLSLPQAARMWWSSVLAPVP
jgi:hypothetical protein